jgi:glycolate oxidase FAD binding subunit
MRPADEMELAEAVRGAAAPFVIRGGGTRGIGRPAPGEVLETGGLSGLELYEPGALTLVARAGTPLAEVQAVLAGERQRLSFEPPDLRGILGRTGEATLGGVAAANASGPRRVQSGAARDSLIGVRFVDGTGAVVKNGGRVMKNVTGYDLVKLLAGSHGTLGVLTEVAFRVQAIPEAEATLVGEGLGAEAALAALRRALGSPFDVSGAAFAGGRALVRVEGMAGSVAYRAGQLRALLGGWAIAEGAASAALWQAVRDVTALAGRPGALWRLSVVPTEAMTVPRALEAAGIAHEAAWDWGGGLLWLLVPEGGAEVVRAAVRGIGHATLVRGDLPAVPVFPPEPPEVAALTAGLRAKFDPKALFNRGLMG